MAVRPFAREVRVPLPGKASTLKKDKKRQRLLQAKPRQTVANAMWSVHWAGTPIRLVTPPRLGEIARTPVTQVLRLVRWTGEAPPEPTSAQMGRSVRSILDSIQWEG
ncbi:MAG: hypothetical protein AAF355_12910 [Myxococcota bacterium]